MDDNVSILLIFAGGVVGFFLYDLMKRYFRRRDEAEKHRRKLDLRAREHEQRLELADKIDATIHVLVADKELASTFDQRLQEAMKKAGIPLVRVDESLGDEDDEEDDDDKKEPTRARKAESKRPKKRG